MVARALFVIASLVCSMGVAAPAQAGMTCTSHRLSVSPEEGRAKTWTISAKLCVPSGKVNGVDVLVHGATYNGSYWDWPFQPETYSYVRKTVRAGRAALTYDRPGTGTSSRPAASEVNVAADAYIAYQLLRWMRRKDFGEVTLVGHSLGSIIATAAAARYPGVDRLVLTGMLHPGPFGRKVFALLGGLYPASADPLFAGRGYGPGYVTTRPGTRAAPFFHAPAADPKVIAQDEETKDVSSLIEQVDSVAGMMIPPALNESARITAPVLIVVGAEDAAVCGPLVVCTDASALLKHERPYFASAASLTAETIPATGHDLTLHTTAAQSFSLIDAWIARH
ncbi:alpha/beta fold hydrolase [Actinocorallia sp. B10E7]|uniref:alpha/beta hydrolase n=1 Tax=Actinocorallia sp. B10E7 TaxID=3153558 RepID=UPI00325CC5D4